METVEMLISGYKPDVGIFAAGDKREVTKELAALLIKRGEAKAVKINSGMKPAHKEA